MDALSTIEGFGADHVAAAVVGPSGTLAANGELSHEFALASVTKLLTAYAVFVAIEERLIDLDTPAGPPGATVAHLLSHASGIHPTDPDRILAAVGVRRIYSSAGYELLGDLVAKEAGMSFSAYLTEGVLEPLGMTATSCPGSPGFGARSNAEDLVRFMSELFSPTLIDSSTLAEATRVAFAGLSGVLPGFGHYAPCDWGLGFELRDDKSPHWTGRHCSPATFGHFGQAGSCCLLDPAAGAAMVVLSDLPFGPWAKRAWPELIDSVLDELDAGSAPPSTATLSA